jgi:hypothetical protein
MTLLSWYEGLNRAISVSESPLAASNKDRCPWAVPFFGKLLDAEVLTVGLNPSYSEFEGNRWSGINKAEEALNRLLEYFDCNISPHRWFGTWETALHAIEASYYDGTRRYLAAHVDVWPRATRGVSGLPSSKLEETIRRELPFFVSTLKQAKNVRLILMAGSVTTKFYLNHFLKVHLQGGSELRGSFDPFAQRGPGKTVFHRLRIGRRELPVFFCSTSPSGNNREVLVKMVRRYRIPIMKQGRLGQL